MRGCGYEEGSGESIEEGSRESIEEGSGESIEEGSRESIEESIEEGSGESIEEGSRESIEEGSGESIGGLTLHLILRRHIHGQLLHLHDVVQLAAQPQGVQRQARSTREGRVDAMPRSEGAAEEQRQHGQTRLECTTLELYDALAGGGGALRTRHTNKMHAEWAAVR